MLELNLLMSLLSFRKGFSKFITNYGKLLGICQFAECYKMLIFRGVLEESNKRSPLDQISLFINKEMTNNIDCFD
jgi:hypothetical protein